MKDENDTSVPMTHDGYLKLYQLKWKPDFCHTLKQAFDVLLIDEAQVSWQQCGRWEVLLDWIFLVSQQWPTSP